MRYSVLAMIALLLTACSSNTSPSQPGTSGAEVGQLASPQSNEQAAPESRSDVFVNGERLEEETLQQLEAAYGVQVKPGRYWYDSISGVWGLEGGPAAGMVASGLRLGGGLREDASNGDTGVVVNGRELHQLDVAALRRCVQTIPGRYWVNASGIGGYEGGPAMFDLNALCNAARGGGDMPCENYGGGQFNCGRSGTRTGAYGVIGEGGGQGGVYTDQGLIMTPN